MKDEDGKHLLVPSPDGFLKTWPVAREVGNIRNNIADLISPPSPGFVRLNILLE